MKENLKKIVIIISTLGVLLGSVVYGGTLVKKVYFSCYPIMIDDEEYASEMPILSYQGRTYVCLREFSNMVGVGIDFRNDTIYIETEERRDVKVIFEEDESLEESTEKENQNTNENDSDKIVYISASGAKYHNLKKCNNATYYQITLKDALEKGYKPCARCVDQN